MNIITIYAVVCNGNITTTTHKEKQAIETAEILNKTHNTKDYIIVACNGLCL